MLPVVVKGLCQGLALSHYVSVLSFGRVPPVDGR